MQEQNIIIILIANMEGFSNPPLGIQTLVNLPSWLT